MSKKTIGILGGMGPEASAYFYQLLIKLAHTKYNAVQDTDFPPIIIYNLPLFGFNETGIVDKELVKSQLIEGVKKLELAGSDFIIIACNTVHYFYSEMQNNVKIPILNIVEETSIKVKDNNIETVGILSSESTNKLQIYNNTLQKFGINSISVDNNEQKELNRIINRVMAGKQDNSDTDTILKIIDHLTSQGAQGVILGCTELPLAYAHSDINKLIFNSNEIIIDKALQIAFAD